MPRKTNPDLSEWITREEAVQLLGIKKQTFAQYLCEGKIPQSVIKHSLTKKSVFFQKPTLMGFGE